MTDTDVTFLQYYRSCPYRGKDNSSFSGAVQEFANGSPNGRSSQRVEDTTDSVCRRDVTCGSIHVESFNRNMKALGVQVGPHSQVPQQETRHAYTVLIRTGGWGVKPGRGAGWQWEARVAWAKEQAAMPKSRHGWPCMNMNSTSLKIWSIATFFLCGPSSPTSWPSSTPARVGNIMMSREMFPWDMFA
jgi:hypothetical protein